jgi:hypothetical protein
MQRCLPAEHFKNALRRRYLSDLCGMLRLLLALLEYPGCMGKRASCSKYVITQVGLSIGHNCVILVECRKQDKIWKEGSRHDKPC